MLTADMWTQVRGRREWDELGDGNLHIYTATCKTDSLWKFAVWHQELKNLNFNKISSAVLEEALFCESKDQSVQHVILLSVVRL